MSETGEMREDRDDRRRKAAFAVLALVALVGLVAWWLLARLVAVPDVTGLTRTDAVAKLEAAGLRVGEVVNVDATSDQTPGTVVAQSPGAGNRLLRGSTIGISLAEAMDADSGRETASAGSGLIDDSYLDLPEEGRETDDVGLVPDSPPSESGPQVPLVMRKSASSAKAILSSAGYGMNVKRAASTTNVPAGQIMRQDPPPDAREPRGTVVTVWVSTGLPQ